MTDAFPLDPPPDQDAWDAYLEFALDHLGADGSASISLSTLAQLEAAAGTQLPYEIGLMLVMGVPSMHSEHGAGWRRWGDDPAAELAQWNAGLLHGILFDVENNHTWMPSWGPRPDEHGDRAELVTAQFEAAPQLLPLYGHRAVPLTIADGETTADGNPVFSIVQTDIITYGDNLADWMHREFDVPLPMWTRTTARSFPFWTELIMAD